MANHSITFSCGHVADKQLYGKHADRERFVVWAGKNQACPACSTADKAIACEAIEAEYDMPMLAGSDKQVAWARSIRAEKFADIQKFFAETQTRVPADKMEMFETQCAVVLQAVIGKTGAAFWIDNRDSAGRLIADAAFKAARS